MIHIFHPEITFSHSETDTFFFVYKIFPVMLINAITIPTLTLNIKAWSQIVYRRVHWEVLTNLLFSFIQCQWTPLLRLCYLSLVTDHVVKCKRSHSQSKRKPRLNKHSSLWTVICISCSLSKKNDNKLLLYKTLWIFST